MPILITINQAAARARCDENQIIEWIDEGVIDTWEVKGKKTNIILGKSLAKWLSRQWIRNQRKKMAACGIDNMNIEKWF